MEDYTDQMQVELRKYLLECSKENISNDSRDNLNAFLRIVNELESIGDSCYNLILLTQRRIIKKIPLHETARSELEPYTAKVQEFLIFIKEHLNQHLSTEAANRAYRMEEEINTSRNQLRKKARNSITMGADVKGELLFIDLVRHIEHIGDYCLNIAQSLTMIH